MTPAQPSTRNSRYAGEYVPFPSTERRNFLQERVEVPALIAALRLPLNARILEVGCGRGIALPVFARICQPSRIVGIDIDREALADARARSGKVGYDIELVDADVRSMPFEDDSFDAVVDFGTCFHIGRPDEAIAEIARVLVAGGVFVHETKISQLMSHPIRSHGRRIPWETAPMLAPERGAVLWSSRRLRDETVRVD